jgi:hypothetical protein
VKQFLIPCLLAAAASPLQADLILSVSPAFQTITAGQTVLEQINVSGVAGGTANVGAFDLHLDFDPLVLAPLKVSFGVSLGDPSSQAFTSVSLLPGQAQLAEASLLDAATLEAAQANAFGLAQIEFEVVGTGISALSFSQTVVDDPFGGKLTVTSTPGTLTGVPEANSLMLVFLGLAAAGVGCAGKKRFSLPERAGPE